MYSVLLLDHLLRFAAAGVAALAIIVLLRARRRERTHALVAGFLACLVAYLVLSAPGAQGLPGALRLPLLALATVAPGMLWLAARGLFIDDSRLSAAVLSPLLGLAALGLSAFLGKETQPGTAALASYSHKAVAIVLYANALWCAWSGYGADLIEARRRFRLWFVGGAALIGLAIAVAEGILRGHAVPPQLEMLKSAAILIPTLLLAAWAFELKTGWFSGVRPAAPPDMPAGERQLLAALAQAMDGEHAYREPGLTIAALARRLKAPETLLRRVINGRLGYRNFNTFLNERRLEEARAALCDPARARVPVLTIALESGFASIGPFNRAFRQTFSCSPTEFRRAAESPKAQI